MGEVDRMPWPDRWIARADPGDIRACRDLWACVLASCLQGALNDAMKRREGGNYFVRGDRVSAHWIDSRDFHMVCALAGLDGVAVAETVRVALEGDGAARHRMLNRLACVGARSSGMKEASA